MLVPAVLGLAMQGVARADTLTWNFFETPGSDHAFPAGTVNFSPVSGSVILPATGYITQNAPPVQYSGGNLVIGAPDLIVGTTTWTTGNLTPGTLYTKNDGANEQGTGLQIDANHEIAVKHFVQLDTSNELAAGYSDLLLGISSDQVGEDFLIWGSNTPGVAGTLLDVGTHTGVNDSGSYDFTDMATYRYVSVSAIGGTNTYVDPNVLLSTAFTEKSGAIPEPASLGLLGVGAVSLLLRRRRKS